jgi:hypothetical protein
VLRRLWILRIVWLLRLRLRGNLVLRVAPLGIALLWIAVRLTLWRITLWFVLRLALRRPDAVFRRLRLPALLLSADAMLRR